MQRCLNVKTKYAAWTDTVAKTVVEYPLYRNYFRQCLTELSKGAARN